MQVRPDPSKTIARAPDRRVGLELEFAGLDEAQAARVLAKTCGAEAQATGATRWQCDTESFGTCEVYLDTRFDEEVNRLGGAPALDVLRSVVPVELVTEPFALADLPAFDQVVDALRNAGALGSRDGLFYGFGLHLNVEIASHDASYLAARLTAYALLERYLRADDPIDLSRRVLPFVAPYAEAFVDALAEAQPDTLDDLTQLYMTHAPSRDHGLDLLPILSELGCLEVWDTTELGPVKARPAFHFRLPDCRIDEPGWSVLDAWRHWSLVEAVAADPALLDQLRAARRDWSTENRLIRPDWADEVAHILNAGTERTAS